MQEYNAPIEDILFVLNNVSSEVQNKNDEYSDPDLMKQIFDFHFENAQETLIFMDCFLK